MPVFFLIIGLTLIYLSAKGKLLAVLQIIFTDAGKVTSGKKNAR